MRTTQCIPETFTILNGASLSNKINLDDRAIIAVAPLAAWTTAVVTFLVGYKDGTTMYPVLDKNGNEYQVTVAADKVSMIPASDFPGVQWLQLRSGTSGTPVVQGADRTVRVITRAV